MLTGKQVRVRYSRKQIVPHYLDVADTEWLESAERLLHLYRSHLHKTRGELEYEIDEVFGDSPAQQVYQGLAKLLEDRCEFAVVSGHPPEQLRDAVFRAAAEERRQAAGALSVLASNEAGGNDDRQSPVTIPHFDRSAVLEKVAKELETSPEQVENGLFADLRSEQQIVSFKDISAERLLQRYNVALAQAVLLRATSVEVIIRNEPPQRYRQLLRRLKFYRLMCEIEAIPENTYRLKLDGPLSLFLSTQKYGFQLAMFLPVILLCKDFELHAEVRWGPQRTPKEFKLSSKDDLVSHYVDSGMYVPEELSMFAQMFRKRISHWTLVEEPEIMPLGKTFWIPDFQLVHGEAGKVVYIEVLGFWRRSSVEKHLQLLKQNISEPFILAVSDQLRIEDEELEGMPASVYRFRQMPLAQEVARLADEMLSPTSEV